MSDYPSNQKHIDPGPRWIDRATHCHWLTAEGLDLLEFYRAACLPGGGFGALDVNGELASPRADTLITARMTHCYALAAIQGVPGASTLADHGVTALAGLLRDDDEYDGWFAAEPTTSFDPGFDNAKQCYIHVFVALGAASALAAGIDGALELLDDVLQVLETRFWAAEEQAYVESYARDWAGLAAYRGANANMHAVELCLELADVLDDNAWRLRALAIAERLIHRVAADNGWRVIEHFDSNWQVVRDYNADKPDDGFKPFGATPGHGCEWARLLLHLEAGLAGTGADIPGWLTADAAALFGTAMTEGWETDGNPGLVYTVDWDGQPCSRRRRHWVHAEAAAAAAALAERTGDAKYETWYRRLWDFMRDVYVDDQRGSWLQELNGELDPYPGEGHLKPDLYHAYQATLLPRAALAPTLALSVANV